MEVSGLLQFLCVVSREHLSGVLSICTVCRGGLRECQMEGRDLCLKGEGVSVFGRK